MTSKENYKLKKSMYIQPRMYLSTVVAKIKNDRYIGRILCFNFYDSNGVRINFHLAYNLNTIFCFVRIVDIAETISITLKEI